MSGLPHKRLTNAQVRELASALDGESLNVFDVAAEMFEAKPGDEVFDQLASLGYAKCSECNVWQMWSPDYLKDGDPICDVCLDSQSDDVE